MIEEHKEYIELAAKAVGFQIISWQHGKAICKNKNAGDNKTFHWNPITDSGNALHLATRLHLIARPCALEDGVAYCGGCYQLHRYGEVMDVEAATRLVITRAAAEIQRRKEKNNDLLA